MFDIKSITHFELLFVQSVKLTSKFFFPFYCECKFYYFVFKALFFLHWNVFASLSKNIVEYIYVVLSWYFLFCSTGLCVYLSANTTFWLVWLDKRWKPYCRLFALYYSFFRFTLFYIVFLSTIISYLVCIYK